MARPVFRVRSAESRHGGSLIPGAAAEGRRLAKVVRRMIDEELQERFDTLVNRWIPVAQVASVTHLFVGETAYQEMLALGPDVVPLILDRLEEEGDTYFWLPALNHLVGEDMAAGAESKAEARAAWLRWGREMDHL